MDKIALIVGNGPSLRDVPVGFLHAYDSFGTNKIFCPINAIHFTPTYYVAVNDDLIPFVGEINKLECVKYISSRYANLVPGSIPLKKVLDGKRFFTKQEPGNLIWEGFSVTYICLQIAYWLGYDTALLVGVDHRYSNEQQQGNHYCNEYEEGIPIIRHDMEMTEPAYELARDAYQKAGRRIINLTPNSALDIFEKGNLLAWIP